MKGGVALLGGGVHVGISFKQSGHNIDATLFARQMERVQSILQKSGIKKSLYDFSKPKTLTERLDKAITKYIYFGDI